MAVTIKDVAALAGVSPSTVSRTCKNNASISEETKERVRKAMLELGYEPNFQASNLASQNSRTIGIILPASAKEVYENSFYLEAIQGISHYCNGRQYMTTIVTGQDEEEILDAVRSMSRSGKVDGFIVLYSRKDDPVIDFLFNEGLLYILIGKATSYTNQTIYIDNDNLLAGREATEYLYQLGHRKIAYLGSDSALMFSADRKAGYQLALTSHQIPVRPEYCIEVKNVSANNENAIRGLLMQEAPPTAILVSDDILAVSLERVCPGKSPVHPGRPVHHILQQLSLCKTDLTTADIDRHQLWTTRKRSRFPDHQPHRESKPASDKNHRAAQADREG